MAADSGRLNEISLSGGDLAGLMQAVLEKNARFRFKARGFSMTPFIRDHDVITVAAVKGGPAVGDVAAVVHPKTGTVIVHRIVGRKNQGFVLKGDNCADADGVFDRSRIIGVVCGVRRNNGAVWYAGGPEKRVAAFLSRSGINRGVNRGIYLFRGIFVRVFGRGRLR
ncbi:MAG: S24/S26 family peptidase [Desulfobacteraceae bacterium]|nr:S24/S26 family peptidase [Desulfobacteraceae bacterium]